MKPRPVELDVPSIVITADGASCYLPILQGSASGPALAILACKLCVVAFNEEFYVALYLYPTKDKGAYDLRHDRRTILISSKDGRCYEHHAGPSMAILYGSPIHQFPDRFNDASPISWRSIHIRNVNRLHIARPLSNIGPSSGLGSRVSVPRWGLESLRELGFSLTFHTKPMGVTSWVMTWIFKREERRNTEYFLVSVRRQPVKPVAGGSEAHKIYAKVQIWTDPCTTNLQTPPPYSDMSTWAEASQEFRDDDGSRIVRLSLVDISWLNRMSRPGLNYEMIVELSGSVYLDATRTMDRPRGSKKHLSQNQS